MTVQHYQSIWNNIKQQPMSRYFFRDIHLCLYIFQWYLSMCKCIILLSLFLSLFSGLTTKSPPSLTSLFIQSDNIFVCSSNPLVPGIVLCDRFDTRRGTLHMPWPSEPHAAKDCCNILNTTFLENWYQRSFVTVFVATDPTNHWVMQKTLRQNITTISTVESE